MPSKAAGTPITGRCYCGAISLHLDTPPLTVAYCHCGDCKRWTGAPLPAFAAFPETALTATPALPTSFSTIKGVERWVCPTCGSPLAATFGYLPGQIYVPLGVLDQAAELAPALHCHAEAALPWLKMNDTAPRITGSARQSLCDTSTND